MTALAELLAITTELQSLDSAREAIEADLDGAKARDTEARRAAAIKAVADRRKALLVASAKRKEQATEVQRAGAAFLEALRGWRQVGNQLRTEAQAVVVAYTVGEADCQVSTAIQLIAPAAAGTTTRCAEALATTLVEAMQILGSPSLSEYVLRNEWSTPDCDFVTAAAEAHAALVERIEHGLPTAA